MLWHVVAGKAQQSAMELKLKGSKKRFSIRDSSREFAVAKDWKTALLVISVVLSLSNLRCQ